MSRTGMTCVSATCGNGFVDQGEDCDDSANGDDADGCTDLCSFSCSVADDCGVDGNECNGVERCDVTTHRCAIDPAPTYDWYVDCDGDGRTTAATRQSCAAPTDPPTCGPGLSGLWVMRAPSPPDCDDTNPAIYPGASESCSGGIDLDCDAMSRPGTNVVSPAGRAYRFCSDLVGPPTARDSCIAMGYRLAAVETEAESTYLTTVNPSAGNHWIALLRPSTTWEWWDWGTTVTNDLWDADEPDASEGCGGLRPWGLWFGLNCGTSARYGYICEMP
jgi:putative metal-binding protein